MAKIRDSDRRKRHKLIVMRDRACGARVAARLNGKDVAADGFGFFRLIDVAVELGFAMPRDAGFGDDFTGMPWNSSCNCKNGKSFLLARIFKHMVRGCKIRPPRAL